MKGTMNKFTKLVLSFLMVVTCVNLSSINAGNENEENYTDNTLIETQSENPPESSETVEESVVESSTSDLTEDITDSTATTEAVDEVVEQEMNDNESTESLADITFSEETEVSNETEESVGDFSESIDYAVNYNEDNSVATVVISLNGEDENVYLDLKNADDEAFSELYESGKLAVNEEMTSYSSLAFDVAQSGDYTFNVGVYNLEDSSELGSKEFDINVTLSEEGEVDGEYETAVTKHEDKTINIWESITLDADKPMEGEWYQTGRGIVTIMYNQIQGIGIGTTTVIHEYNNEKGEEITDTWTVTVTDSVKAYVYVNGSGYSDEALELMGIDPETKDNNGYFPVGEIKVSKSFFNNKNSHGQSLINSTEDWSKLKSALSSLNTQTLTGKYVNNKGNKIGEYLIQATGDLNQYWGSGKTNFGYFTDTSYGFDDQSVKYHLDLHFNTSVITYKTGNNGIATGNAKDGSEVGTRTFISGSTAKEPSDTSFIPEGYRLAGYYTDRNFKNEWIPGETTVTEGTTIYVKLVEKDKVAIEYVAGTGGEVTLVRENVIIDGGTPTGSTACASTGYVFAGWYSDLEYTKKVSDSTNFVPSEKWESGKVYTYYAKFELDKDTFTVDTLNPVKYNGTEQNQVPVIKNSKGEVVDNSNFDITYSSDTTNVGTVTVTVTPKADSKFTGKATTSYNITQRKVTINAVDSSKVYGTDNPKFTWALGNGSDDIYGSDLGTITVSRTSKNENVGTYENDLVVSYTENKNYEVVTNPAKFEITAADGLDIKAKSKSKKYDGEVLSVEAKSSVKGVTITYSTNDGETWSKNVPSITNAGSITVIAKASKENYNDVTVSYTLKVTKRNVTIKSDSKSKKYDGKALTSDKITIGGDKFVKGEEPTLKATGTITNVGTAKNTIEVVKYSDKYIADNYDLTFTEGTLEVKKSSDLKITVKDAKKEYDGTSLTSEATSKTKGTTILYSTDGGKTWSEETPSIKDAGKLTVKVKATNPNYNDATASYKLEVIQREVTITSNSDSKTYDGTPLTNKHYKVTKGSFVKGENVTIQTTGSITDVGKTENTVEVTYGDNCNANNYKVTFKLGTLEVKAADFKLKNLQNVNYNCLEQKQDVVITDKKGNVLDHNLFEITYSKDTTNAGKVTVTVKAKKNTNYSGTKMESYDIEKAELTIKTNSDSKEYDGTPLTADGSIEGLVNGETVTFTVTGSQTDVGSSKNTYYLKWNGTADKDNYVVKSDCGKLIVEAAEFTVDDLSNVKYEGTSQKLLPVVKSGDKTLTNKKDYTLTYSDDTKNVGTVIVTVKGKGNYTGTVTKTYEITKREVTLTSKSDEKVYDGTPLTNSEVTISGDGFVEGEGATYNVTGTITDVGSVDNAFTYALNDGTNAGNYNITPAYGILTVTSKSFPTPVDPEDPSKGETESDVTIGTLNDVVYNGQSQTQAPEVKDNTLGELTEGTDYEVSYSENTTDVGTVTVTITGVGNYTGSTTRTYNITKAPLTITTDSASKNYDGQPLTAGGNVEGLVNGETVTLTTTGTITDEGEAQNTYTLTWDGSAKEGNYEVTENLGTLKIEAAAPVVTPETPTTTPVANNTTPTTPVTPTRRTTPVTPVTPVVTPTATTEATEEPEVTPTPSATPTATPETIDDDSTPEVAPKVQWALINLIAAMLSVLLGVIVILSKHSEDEEDEDDDQVVESEEDDKKSTRHRRWKVIAGIDAIASVVVFILTENITNQMVLVDKWTILMVAFALIAVVSTYFGRKWHEDEEDEDSSENA